MRFIAAAWLGLIAAPAAAQTAATDAAEPEPPIIIDAENSSADLRAGITRMSERVEIRRGAMLVHADAGAVYQEDGRIVEVELTGNPVTWRDRLDDGTLVEGEALMIVFDVVENIVTLTGNARLRHDQGQFAGDELVYDLDTENLAGRSDEGNRVRMVIEPEATRDDGGSEDAAPEDPPQSSEPPQADPVPATGGGDQQSAPPAAPASAVDGAGEAGDAAAEPPADAEPVDTESPDAEPADEPAAAGEPQDDENSSDPPGPR